MRNLTENDFDLYLEHLKKQTIILWSITTHEACIDAYDFLKTLPFNPKLVELAMVDVDREPKLAMKYSIRKVPFVTVFSKKRIVSSGFLKPVDRNRLTDIIGKQAYETFTTNI